MLVQQPVVPGIPAKKDVVRQLEERLAGVAPEDRGSTLEIDILNTLAWELIPVDVRRSTELFEQALASSDALSYELGSARAITGAAFFDFFRADYGRVLAKTRESAPVLREHGTAEDRASLLLIEGLVYWSMGDFEVALDSFQRCHNTSTQVGYVYGEGWALTSLGSIYAELGDADKAVELQKRSVACFRAGANKVGEGRASSGLGAVYLRQGRLDEALEVLERSLWLNRAAGSELSAARALNDMGSVYEARRESGEAEECLAEALAIRERHENWPAVVTTLLALGKLYNDTDRPDAAATHLTRAVQLCEKIATRPKLWQAHAALSRSYELQGEYREALDHLRRGQAIKEEVQGEDTGTKLKNLQIKHEVETAEKEAELQRVRSVELAGALERLKQAQSRLVQSEKMAAIGNLVAGVAHELNNPVAALTCGMDVQVRAASKVRELVSAGVSGDAARLERTIEALTSGAENSARACERIATMVRSLQSFSQLDQAGFQRVDIHEGIESTLALARARWGETIRWETRFDALPTIECYPGALNQALMTLLVNAAESIRDSVDGTGTVTVTTGVAGANVRLKICDTGQGIPADKLGSVFEIGFNNSGERVRMTTGLANVRATIEKHHGRISVQSELGQGTSFEIELPISQPSGAKTRAEATKD